MEKEVCKDKVSSFGDVRDVRIEMDLGFEREKRGFEKQTW